MIAVVEYGAGNVRSVTNALARLGHPATVTSDADCVLAAKAVVFPGVGAAGDTMRRLSESGLAEAIRRRVAGAWCREAQLFELFNNAFLKRLAIQLSCTHMNHFDFAFRINNQCEDNFASLFSLLA